ncbi:histidinol-phosphate aminotransferase [Ottowia sp. oral taxon 894]|uniref:pyridoxal phosphate-dependent aminotransferase n=1 Tax=Ottowia sp. oral taxon 894 TaxID=1658672 RepID=UPI0006820938|nr:aminotransferase class I/II-fold pyridoxal phosphate-dependent enzyme [Ottowia sp. oral taxon 894]AKU66377.1 histidinol-phosphate aminotransferase [Ottowia sp. oral taxon 894]
MTSPTPSSSAALSAPLPALERIRADVQAMHAYLVQSSEGLLKLDAMENPYGLPPELQQALGERLGRVAINRYPGTRFNDLKAALARHARLPEGWALMLGNGSDELITLLALCCSRQDGEQPAAMLAPMPSFVMYPLAAHLHHMDFHAVPLRPDFQLDEAAMLAAIESLRPALLWLSHPNNPTGTLWDEAAMARLIEAQGRAGGIAVIDEAYQPFAARTWLDAARQRPAEHAHVLVMRTLSKFGLAGVRVGYLMGDERLISQIDKARPPYNLGSLNIECALFALEHAGVFDEQARLIRQERERLQASLHRLPGTRPYSSEGNMVLLRVAPEGAPASEAAAFARCVFEGMKARGVLVRDVSAMHPMLAGCLRLTVGSASDNARMLAALTAALADALNAAIQPA